MDKPTLQQIHADVQFFWFDHIKEFAECLDRQPIEYYNQELDMWCNAEIATRYPLDITKARKAEGRWR